MPRKPDPRAWSSDTSAAADEGHRPCSRTPPELCDGARLAVQPDGTSKRVPALTPRPFCDPCRSRIITCLEELPGAYRRLAERIGDPVRAGEAVRVPPGSRVLVSPEIDALMRTMAGILGAWAARVRSVPGLQLNDPGFPPDSLEAVEDSCLKVLVKHPDALLSLQAKWMFRTFTYPVAAPFAARPETVCRHCGRRISSGMKPGKWWLSEHAPGSAECAHEPAWVTERPDVIPAGLLAETGDSEIIRQGDGWFTVMNYLDGKDAGNEVIDLHWRTRRVLGETPARPEAFDGVPCRNCDLIALRRAEPPSDPSLPAMHSRCAECGHEMTRDEFTEWAGRYASYARGAGIQKCRRCSLQAPRHEDCCWVHCSCAEGEHPRRPAAA